MNRRVAGVLAGWLAAAAGLAVAELAAGVVGSTETPLVAVGSVFVDHVPLWLKNFATSTFGTYDKAALTVGMLIVLAVLAGVIGVLAVRRRSFAWLALVIAALGVAAAASRPDFGGADVVPSVVAGLGAALTLRGLAGRATGLPMPARRVASADASQATRVAPPPVHGSLVGYGSLDADRRTFLTAAGVTLVGTAAAGGLSQVSFGQAKEVAAARSALTLPKPPTLTVPAGANLRGVSAAASFITPWQTDNNNFYRVDTRLSVPRIDPADWRLRIHGMVDKEITLTFDDLIKRKSDFAWVTLCCVSNPVAGDLIGNAMWGGTRIARLLAEAGVAPGADAIKQTSQDGWTCGTPIEAVTDGRNALLAYSMNGSPLPEAHGFPVRMVVPGLYGYVSATKWIVDIEVTTFDTFSAYWTERGWSQRGPIKIESRIDYPHDGAKLKAGDVVVTGVAWAQHTGIAGVEVQVNDEPWQRVEMATAVNKDTWRMWKWTWANAAPGNYNVQARATDVTGRTQTVKTADVVPNGASGYPLVSVQVEG